MVRSLLLLPAAFLLLGCPSDDTPDEPGQELVGGAYSGALITIRDRGSTDPNPRTASVYPASLVISTPRTRVLGIKLTLVGLSHTAPSDIDMLLVGPQGQASILISDTMGGSSIVDKGLRFSDLETAALPGAGGWPGLGPWKATNLSGTGDPFPAVGPVPPPAGPHPADLGTFLNTNPNGLWRLYVVDDLNLDAGTLTGWTLDLLVE